MCKDGRFYDSPLSTTTVPILYSYGTNGLFVQNQSHMADAGASALTFSNETGRTNLSAKAVLFKTVREYPPRNDPVHQDVAVHVLPDEDTVQIIMSGPHDVWFGVGFGSDTMNGTYAVIADTATTVREYILSADSFGNGIYPNNLKVTTATTDDGQRTITMERPLSLLQPKAYNFPVSPQSVPIIASYGNMFPFNDTGSFMVNATATTLEFKSFTPTPGGGGGNHSMCSDDRTSYGTSGAVGNGLTVGLTIYCQSKTIRMSMEYGQYESNWFGIVFNDEMCPSPYSAIFTTGKPDESQRDLDGFVREFRVEMPDDDDGILDPQCGETLGNGTPRYPMTALLRKKCVLRGHFERP